MKIVVIFLFMTAFLMNVSAQLFPTIDPHYPRPGAVWVIKASPRIVPYISIMGGPMKDVGMSIKVSGGAGFRLNPEKGRKATCRILLGTNHTNLWNEKYEAQYVRRYSLEAGVMITEGRLSVLALTDPLMSTRRTFYPETRFGASWRFGKSCLERSEKYKFRCL